MTNINNINDPARSAAPVPANDPRNKQASFFENVLSSAFDKKQVSGTKEGVTSGLNEIESPAPDIHHPKDVVSGETDNLINLLETYSSQLDNPHISLKKIAPMMEDIKNNAGKLIEQAGRLTTSDASLKKIATQAAVTAQAEYFKFQRGDYLS